MSAHEYLCHVRFSDVDVYGHVNNVKYFEYFQEARLAFITAVGGRDDGDIGLVVARMEVDYKRPILFRAEPYVVRSRVLAVGRSSFTLAADVMDGEDVLSRSRSVLVAFDLAEQRSRPLTDRERAALEKALDPA